MEAYMRLELFVQNLKRSVDFYKNVIQLDLYSQNETSARFRSKNLNILLTQQNILSKDHYFSNISTSRKGVGVEIIIIVPDIQNFHQRISEMEIELESQLKQQEWGLKDFRLVDPDGYYLRISSPPN